MANPPFIEVQKSLDGVDYPVDRAGLVEHARSHGAGDEVVQMLEGLPDRTFDGPTAVSEAVSRE
jgi:hypothetical protein